MDPINLILTVTVINLVGTMSPGPSFIIVAQNAINHSRKAGICTTLGIVLADMVHVTYCLLGIAVLISKSILLFNAIKYLGALYLIYLGIKSVFSKSEINVQEEGSTEQLSDYQAFKNGFLVTLLNPKATLLFLGIFTVTIPAGTPTIVMAITGAIMLLSIFLWYLFVAVFLTQNTVRSIFLKFKEIFNKAFGSLLVALGVKVALSQK